MELFEAIKSRRTIRKFKQTPIEKELLVNMIEAARLAPSGANIQPLKYIVISKKDLLGKVFENTRWAGYLGPEGTPKENERPVAYIMILIDTTLRANADNDASLAAANIMLTAHSYNIGSCMIGALMQDELRDLFNIDEKLIIHSVIALGYPAQQGFCEEMKDSVKYYLDDSGNIHVPKRKIEDISIFY